MTWTLNSILLYIITIPVAFAIGRISARITFINVRRRHRHRRPAHIELMGRGKE